MRKVNEQSCLHCRPPNARESAHIQEVEARAWNLDGCLKFWLRKAESPDPFPNSLGICPFPHQQTLGVYSLKRVKSLWIGKTEYTVEDGSTILEIWRLTEHRQTESWDPPLIPSFLLWVQNHSPKDLILTRGIGTSVYGKSDQSKENKNNNIKVSKWHPLSSSCSEACSQLAQPTYLNF